MSEYVEAASAVIQAGAAIVIALLTWRLVRVTGTYADLTRDLSRTAKDELDLLRSEAGLPRARLMALTLSLSGRVAHLPERLDTSTASVLSRRLLWTAEELQTVDELARDLDPEAIDAAAAATRVLRQFGELAEAIRAGQQSAIDAAVGRRWNDLHVKASVRTLTLQRHLLGHVHGHGFEDAEAEG